MTVNKEVTIAERHRLAIGGLFLTHGLARSALGLFFLASSPAATFSSAMITVGLAVPSLFGGYNLLANNSGAHSMMSIAALVNVISLPFGTAISVYYYWYWKYQRGGINPFKATDLVPATADNP